MPHLPRFGRRSGTSVPRRKAPDREANPVLGELDIFHDRVVQQVRAHTMTSAERLTGLIDSVQYVVQRQVPGAFVECGVWRGGSVLAMILTLQELRVDDREIYLFDTFEGMTAPTDSDTSPFAEPALVTWTRARRNGQQAWESVFGSRQFGLSQVQDLLASSGYPGQRLHYVVGPVERTLPDEGPSDIALLRLDTDWYESTRHELVHLYPRLAAGGVLLIDDYGHWEGCRRAVDEYFASEAPPLLLSRLDYTGRVGVKH